MQFKSFLTWQPYKAAWNVHIKKKKQLLSWSHLLLFQKEGHAQVL